jgi:hypothetical protein
MFKQLPLDEGKFIFFTTVFRFLSIIPMKPLFHQDAIAIL